MRFEAFRDSIRAGAAPAGLARPLVALWHDAAGDWDAAHTAAQVDEGPDAAWVHGYLHRKEGDVGNAGYWYRRAGRPMPAPGTPLDQEWEDIARSLLGPPR